MRTWRASAGSCTRSNLRAPPALESVARRLWHRMPWLLVGLLGAMVSAGLMKAFEAQLDANAGGRLFRARNRLSRRCCRHPDRDAGDPRSFGRCRDPPHHRPGSPHRTVRGCPVGRDHVAGGGADDRRLDACGRGCLRGAGGEHDRHGGGVALPWLLHRLGKDPAFGAGPLATVMIQDLLSIVIYLACGRRASHVTHFPRQCKAELDIQASATSPQRSAPTAPTRSSGPNIRLDQTSDEILKRPTDKQLKRGPLAAVEWGPKALGDRGEGGKSCFSSIGAAGCETPNEETRKNDSRGTAPVNVLELVMTVRGRRDPQPLARPVRTRYERAALMFYVGRCADAGLSPFSNKGSGFVAVQS